MNDLLRVYNDQAAVECGGYALDGETLVLLDVVGYKTACKSIWATTVNSPRKTFYLSGNIKVSGGDVRLTKYHAFWQELPEQSAHNLVICNRQLLEASPAADVSLPFYIVTGLGEATTPVHLRRFIALLNQALDLPILPDWASWLWEMGADEQLVRALSFGGNVTDAWSMQTDDAKWSALVQSGLQSGALKL